MSTVVQPRREAASYVSTHAGAVGELVVDTTNQRVTVHDGSTLGGFPQAAIADLPGRNTIINGNFAVNQRGYASGGSIGSGAFGHDRWKDFAGGSSYTFTQAATDTTITITSGVLMQPIDVGNVYATSMWLTWAGSAQAFVRQAGVNLTGPSTGTTYVDPVDGPKRKLLVSGIAIGAQLQVAFQGGSVGLVQLEAALPNAGPTRFERRHNELALCQKYYFAYTSSATSEFFWAIPGSGNQTYTVFYPVVMRAVPTVTVTGGSGGTLNSGSPSANVVGTSRATLIGGTSSGYIYLSSFTASAEL